VIAAAPAGAALDASSRALSPHRRAPSTQRAKHSQSSPRSMKIVMTI
jgi:hypothetical protein